MDEKSSILYDPPSGWLYGFPKPYEPLPGESLADTLRRDGYPEEELARITTADGDVRYVRFIGNYEDLNELHSLG